METVHNNKIFKTFKQLKIINTKLFTGIVINNIMKQFSMIKNSLKKIFKN
jgi:hypothetical protein